MKVVAACGNGTAGAFAPRLLSALGCEVVPLDCELDFTFPRYNPNPEDMHMLHAMAAAVKENGADVALGFDGDGDRCGVVDNEGARDFRRQDRRHAGARPGQAASRARPSSSTSNRPACSPTDPELKRQSASRSTIGRPAIPTSSGACATSTPLAGFEKSGHFFFNAPVGRGYDDGFVTAIAVLDMLDRNPGKSMADLYRELPKTWGSPTMSPHCADEAKYAVVDARRRALRGDAGAAARRSPARRSATSSPSTACA